MVSGRCFGECDGRYPGRTKAKRQIVREERDTLEWKLGSKILGSRI